MNLLAEAVQVEKILLMGKPLTGVINETDFKYSVHSSLAEDTVSRQIMNEHNMLIKDRKPVKVSLILTLM